VLDRLPADTVALDRKEGTLACPSLNCALTPALCLVMRSAMCPDFSQAKRSGSCPRASRAACAKKAGASLEQAGSVSCRCHLPRQSMALRRLADASEDWASGARDQALTSGAVAWNK
jgi:hypothetical protein